MAKTKTITLPFPYRGIDKSIAHAMQPGLTTHKARNVRATPPISGRVGGGSRPALKNVFGSGSGSATSFRTTHLEVFPTSVSSVPAADSLLNVEVTETFVGRTITGNASARTSSPHTSTSSSYNTQHIPTNIGGDLVVFCRNEANSGKVDNYYGYRVSDSDGSETSGTLDSGEDGGLMLEAAVSGTAPNVKSRFPGVAVAYQTTNDVEVNFYAKAVATTAGTGAGNCGGQADHNGIGPFIRGSRDLSTYYLATLEPNGSLPAADSNVKLVIWSVNASGVATSVATSGNIKAVKGSSGSYTTEGGCTIRIYQQGAYINATCAWADGWLSNTADILFASYNAGVEPAVGSNATDPENRGGIASTWVTDGTNEAGTLNRFCIRSIKYTKRVPAGAVTMGDLDANSVNLKGGRYYLPVGSASASVTSVPAMAQFGEADSDSNGLYDGEGSDTGPDGSSHNVPRIDTAFRSTECLWGILQGMTATTRTSVVHVQNRNTGNTSRVHVEVRGRAKTIASLDSAAGITQVEDIPGAAIRLATTGATNNWKTGLLIEWKHGAGKDDADPYFDRAMQDSWDTIRLVGLSNGTRTVLKTFTVDGASSSTAIHMPPFRADAYQRWEDSGHAIDHTDYRLYWKVNGIVQLVLRPNSTSTSGLVHGISGTTYSDWITALNATDKTVLSASKNVGYCFWPEASGTIDSYTFGGRVMNIDAELPTVLPIAETKGKVLIFTANGAVAVGDPESGTKFGLVGVGPKNPVVCTACDFNRCFAVDGGTSVYMDSPFTDGVKPWVATAGTLPEKCRLAAWFMGSMVLAAPVESPTLAYVSRHGDPFDWDYGADPVDTAAFAMFTSRYGEPTEPIIALIPAADDVLLFAGSTMMNAMVGDPRAGGQFVKASPGVGIVSPRAWCIDDQGSIWFIGVGGLYRMPPRGGAPENVSRGRLGRAFDNIDSETLFVQMEFDPSSRIVHIFLTNRATTEYSYHYAYDVGLDAFFEDRFDGDRSSINQAKINPWATSVLISSNPVYRRVIIAGDDGAVRMFSDTETHDDGVLANQPIITDVELVVPDDGGMAESMVKEVMVFGYLTSQAFTVNWKTGNSPQDVAEDVAPDDPTVATFTVSSSAASYQRPVSVRRRGGAHKMQITSTTVDRRQALERVVVVMEERGRRR